jgi:hypothetical protein
MAKTKTTDKKPEPRATAAPQQRTGLTIHPDQAHEALGVLAAYIEERVSLIKDKTRIGDTVAAIRAMDHFKRLAEAVATRIKNPLEEGYNFMRFTLVPSFMDDEGITKIGVDGVGRVTLADDLSASVKDKEALKDWLIEHDLEDMITDSINAATLTAFFRNRIKDGKKQDGKDLPDSKIVEVKPFVRASITRE